MHGFARRVDDTVARAISILMNRENGTAKQLPSTSSGMPPKAKKLNQAT
jgi:hypothetical protein